MKIAMVSEQASRWLRSVALTQAVRTCTSARWPSVLAKAGRKVTVARRTRPPAGQVTVSSPTVRHAGWTPRPCPGRPAAALGPSAVTSPVPGPLSHGRRSRPRLDEWLLRIGTRDLGCPSCRPSPRWASSAPSRAQQDTVRPRGVETAITKNADAVVASTEEVFELIRLGVRGGPSTWCPAALTSTSSPSGPQVSARRGRGSGGEPPSRARAWTRSSGTMPCPGPSCSLPVAPARPARRPVRRLRAVARDCGVARGSSSSAGSHAEFRH
jgi:hypothetical protein